MMENGLTQDEIIIESQIKNLQEKIIKENITLEYEKMNYEKISEFHIILTFPSINDNKDQVIKFLLLISLTKKKLYLYSINLIQISDVRDLLPFINQSPSKKVNLESLNLMNIIENIKSFISTISNKDLSKIGRFYLGEDYDINLVSILNELIAIRCFHCDLINGVYINIPSLITISNDYVCLYEYGQIANKHLTDIKNKFTLVFYGTIKSILSFKKSLVGSIVTILFRRDLNNKTFTLKITSDEDEDMDKVMDILIEKIRNVGYRMNIYEKKVGELPKINIEETEKNISEYEEKLKVEENADIIKELLELYGKAIEFYSAINDKRYIEYNNKVRKILKNQKYTELIE